MGRREDLGRYLGWETCGLKVFELVAIIISPKRLLRVGEDGDDSDEFVLHAEDEGNRNNT